MRGTFQAAAAAAALKSQCGKLLCVGSALLRRVQAGLGPGQQGGGGRPLSAGPVAAQAVGSPAGATRDGWDPALHWRPTVSPHRACGSSSKPVSAIASASSSWPSAPCGPVPGTTQLQADRPCQDCTGASWRASPSPQEGTWWRWDLEPPGSFSGSPAPAPCSQLPGRVIPPSTGGPRRVPPPRRASESGT